MRVSGALVQNRIDLSSYPSWFNVKPNLFDGNGWIGGNLFYRRQPGHIASAGDDVGAAIRFTLGF